MDKHDLDFTISKRRRIDYGITEDMLNFKGEGSSKVIEPASTMVDNIVYKLYFKGLVSDKVAEGSGEQIRKAGFGVAICNDTDNLMYEVKESVSDNDIINRKGVEVMALARGLNASASLGIRNILICCDDHKIFQIMTGRWKPNMNISSLVEEVKQLKEKMASSEFVLIARNDVKFAFRLAREAMDSQRSSSSSSSIGVNVTTGEICAICFEETNAEMGMFFIDKCLHHFCVSCVKQHLEVKLREGIAPKCLESGCESELTLESCTNILTTKLNELWRHKIKEDSIPAAQKIYCPYANCSMLMSKTELPSGSDQTNVRACVKCCGLFCIDCKVPAHSGLSCADYKKLNPKSEVEDVKLKCLADDNGWRQCVNCFHYIDRFEGCNHITCRCGYEFCYECGNEWKKSQLRCPSSCRITGHGYVDDSDSDDVDDYDDSDSDSDFYDEDYDDDDSNV